MVLLLCLSYTNIESSEWKLGDDAPSRIKAVIQENGTEIMNLMWRKTDQIVANKYLPVWGAQCDDKHELKEKESAKILDVNSLCTGKGDDYTLTQVIEALLVKHPVKKLFLTVVAPYIVKNPNINIQQTQNRSDHLVSNSYKNHRSLIDIDGPMSSPEFLKNCEVLSVSYFAFLLYNDWMFLAEGNAHDMNTGEEQREYEKKYYLETLLFITHDIVEPM